MFQHGPQERAAKESGNGPRWAYARAEFGDALLQLCAPVLNGTAEGTRQGGEGRRGREERWKRM